MSDDYYWGEPRPSAVPEPVKGAKVARRIAWLGSDFVRRFYIGATKGTALTKEYLSRNNDIDLDNLNDENQYDEREMIGCIEANEAQRYVPRAGYARINGKSQHRGQPGGRFGLKMFETFMRMVELWELDHKGMILFVCPFYFEEL